MSKAEEFIAMMIVNSINNYEHTTIFNLCNLKLLNINYDSVSLDDNEENPVFEVRGIVESTKSIDLWEVIIKNDRTTYVSRLVRR